MALVLSEQNGTVIAVFDTVAELSEEDIAEVRDLAEYYCQGVDDVNVVNCATKEDVFKEIRTLNGGNGDEDENGDED